MDDLDDVPLKNVVAQAVEKCEDTDLLDLIYKLLIYETSQSENA